MSDLPPVVYLDANRIVAVDRAPFSLRRMPAMGYGRKLPTDLQLRMDDGRTRRVYVAQFSNAGSAYVLIKGAWNHIGPEAEERIELLQGMGFPKVDPYKLDGFTRQYLATALWSSNDDSDPETGGAPLDRNYDLDDIAPASMARAVADCDAFRKSPEWKAWTIYLDCLDDSDLRALDYDDEKAGHDFWLTRNGHGAGFWDGDVPAPHGDALTAAAHRAGEVDPYVGDDGRIYI